MRRLTLLMTLAVAALLLPAPVPASAAEPGTLCELIRPTIGGDVIAYQARIEEGVVECAEAEATLTAFVDDELDDPSPAEWDCYFTTEDTPWIATCEGARGVLRADWPDPVTVPVPRNCGALTVTADRVYRLRVRTTDDVGCRTAKRLIERFVERANAGVPAGWECAYGERRHRYSYACGRRTDGVLTLLVQAETIRSRPLGPRYRGWVGGFEDDRRRDRVQGNYHALRFQVTPARSVRYRVCLRGGVGRVSKCFSRRTNSRGRSAINVSLLVNDRGQTGRWRATWHVRGRRVASWTFRLRGEGV